MIVDGRALAKEKLAYVKKRLAFFGRTPKITAIAVSQSKATSSYLSIKSARAIDAGCVLEVIKFPENVSAEELRSTISSSNADALIVQLPLPDTINTREVCDTIPSAKDPDILSSLSRKKFEENSSDALLPPVVGAIRTILERYKVSLQGKRAAIIGSGFLVGGPTAIWFSQQGAIVNVVTPDSNLNLLKEAEIIVSGAGSAHFIKPEMLTPGVVLIDAGTSELAGELAGDADPRCVDLCSVFTPVPGGVGPLAVALLFENVATLMERAINKK